jgi:hypothetical protein
MNVRSLLAIGLVTLAAFVGGCGGADCKSLCEDAKACDGADKDLDCADSCADAVKQRDASGCTAEYDKIISCQAAKADVCDTKDTSCDDEGKAYGECFVKFCTDNPDDENCKF